MRAAYYSIPGDMIIVIVVLPARDLHKSAPIILHIDSALCQNKSGKSLKQHGKKCLMTHGIHINPHMSC
jgi:hypothetical protein